MRQAWTASNGRESGWASDSHHVRGVQPFFSGANLELDLLTFRQSLESLHRDRGKVHEDVFATLLLNEAISLGVIEPFDFPSGHSSCLLRDDTIPSPRCGGASRRWLAGPIYVHLEILSREPHAPQQDTASDRDRDAQIVVKRTSRSLCKRGKNADDKRLTPRESSNHMGRECARREARCTSNEGLAVHPRSRDCPSDDRSGGIA